MDIKVKIIGGLKACVKSVTGFFTKKEKATRTDLKKLDTADIFIALLPVSIFGCLVFGLRAALILAVSVVLSVGLDFLWNLIFKKEKNGMNYTAVISGLLSGLILSSRLNILLVIGVNIIAFALRKTVFKNKPLQITTPVLLSRAVLALVFSGAFSLYAFPFVGGNTATLPLEGMFNTSAYTYPAKYLFFGIHSGNIGETSALLIAIGGIYLIARRIINPIIPAGFIITSLALSLIFGENLALSLLGGGIFFSALFLGLDYSFVTSARYKKILYGVFCGVLTFVLRILFKTECVLFAVLVADIVFIYVTRRNVKRFIRFIKEPDFGKLLNKIKKAFSV